MSVPQYLGRLKHVNMLIGQFPTASNDDIFTSEELKSSTTPCNMARTSAQGALALNPKVLNRVGLKGQPFTKDLSTKYVSIQTKIGFPANMTLYSTITVSAVRTAAPQTQGVLY